MKQERTEIYCREDLPESGERIQRAIAVMVRGMGATAAELRCEGYRHWVVKHNLAGFGSALKLKLSLQDGVYIDQIPPDLKCRESTGAKHNHESIPSVDKR